ncbi:MAG: DUF2807 domain-containing protein [Duncaniella sp.]|nr:DUF2807 domain-containing protein [Duncaniella sp.]
MNRILSSVAFLASILVASAQSPTTYNLNVGEFSELSVRDGINVDYTSDNEMSGTASFACQPSLASAIIFNNKGGKLVIQLSPENEGAKGLPTITVHSRFLTKIENTADSTVRAVSLAGSPKFEAKLEGNGHLIVRGLDANEVKGTMRLGHGTLILTGRCNDAKLKLTGTGVIQADELTATEATVNASGTGSVGVNATSTLNVYGMGSTAIYYIGDPVIKNRSVGLKLNKLTK